MSQDFTVDTGEVRAHAAVVEGFAGRAGTAQEAGAHLTTLDDAYGLLCRPFGQMLVEPQARGTESLAGATRNLQNLAQQLSDTAESYDAVEEKITAMMEELVRRLDVAARAIPTVEGN